MKRYVFSLFFFSSLILGLYLLLGVNPALSIPGGQRDCDINAVSITSPGFAIVPDSKVTVNNGDTARNCIITFSSEVITTVGDATFLNYTIDSTDPAKCQRIGPEQFYSSVTNEAQTVTQMGVKRIGAGTHTIRPCFAVENFSGGSAATTTFADRCLVVECRTQ